MLSDVRPVKLGDVVWRLAIPEKVLRLYHRSYNRPTIHRGDTGAKLSQVTSSDAVPAPFKKPLDSTNANLQLVK